MNYYYNTPLSISLFAVLMLHMGAAGAQSIPHAEAGTPTPQIQEDPGERQGLFMSSLGGTGLNADRARGYGDGLRLLPGQGAYVGYQMGNWSIGSALHRNDNDLDGRHWVDMGARYGFDLNGRNRITFDGGISFRTPQDYGGPSLSDPLRFRSEQHSEPGAGFRLSWRYSFGPNHFVSTILGFDHRFGSSLHDGPEAERNAATFGTVYGYRFY